MEETKPFTQVLEGIVEAELVQINIDPCQLIFKYGVGSLETYTFPQALKDKVLSFQGMLGKKFSLQTLATCKE
jgi:hypothetical protein